MGQAEWNGWRELRAREWIRLRWKQLPGEIRGIWYKARGHEMIVLDSDLDRRERHATLTHELVHSERGISTHGAPLELARKEETIVEREAVRRLVPPKRLAAFCERQKKDGVTAYDVAEEFDVPERVALHALRRLRAGPN